MTTLINCTVYHPLVALPAIYLAEILAAADYSPMGAILQVALRLGSAALRIHRKRDLQVI